MVATPESATMIRASLNADSSASTSSYSSGSSLAARIIRLNKRAILIASMIALWRYAQPMGEIAQVLAAPASPFERHPFTPQIGDFQNECSGKMKMMQLGEQLRPVDFTVSGRQMVVIV